MRYKSVYVVATEEKVILDFEVTDRLPTIEALMPLFIRIKVTIQVLEALSVDYIFKQRHTLQHF